MNFSTVRKPTVVIDFNLPLTPRTYTARYHSVIEIEETITKSQHPMVSKPMTIIYQAVKSEEGKIELTVESNQFSIMQLPTVVVEHVVESSSESEA